MMRVLTSKLSISSSDSSRIVSENVECDRQSKIFGFMSISIHYLVVIEVLHLLEALENDIVEIFLFVVALNVYN